MTEPRCPWCSAPHERLIVRGEMPHFTRWRCADCMAEFDTPPVIVGCGYRPRAGRWQRCDSDFCPACGPAAP